MVSIHRKLRENFLVSSLRRKWTLGVHRTMHHHDTYNKTKLVSKKNYETDIKLTLHYTRILLEILGVWPIIARETRRGKKYIPKTLIVLNAIVLTFPIVPTAIHAIMRESDLIVRLVILCPIGFLFTNFLKYALIVLRSRTLRLCLEDVENDWTTFEGKRDREIMTRNANDGRRLTVISGLFMYTGGMSFHTIVPLWSGNKINEINETIRPLVYPGFDIFVNSQTSPTYEIIFGIFCVSAFVTYTVTTASCNIAALLVTHACGQIEIIMSRLENLVDGIDESRNSDTLQKRISFIIKSHAKVLRLSSRTEKVLREICLVEVVSSTLIICVLEYCMMDWNSLDTVVIITYLALLFSLCFNLFIFCHIGELLKQQCHQVGRATYAMDWYRLPGKTGLALVMVIAIANYPRKLSAGGMMELTISSFGSIIKTSLVYMNMLQTVTE